MLLVARSENQTFRDMQLDNYTITFAFYASVEGQGAKYINRKLS